MSKQLYEEALADVKKLKELAEDNAKRAILEAVTPRIKDLIENQLLGEAKEDDLLLDDEVEDMSFNPSVGAEVAPDLSMSGAIDAVTQPDEEGKITLDLSKLAADSSDEFELSMDNEDAVDALVPSDKVDLVKAESALLKIEKKITNYANASSVLRETKSYLVGLVSTISEVEDMYSSLKNTKNSSTKQNLVQRLKECHKTLKSLMEQETNMKKKLTLNEEDLNFTLKLPDDVDVNLDDVEIELASGMGGEEGEDESESGGDEGGDEGESESSDDELDLGDEEESDEESSDEGGEKEEEKMETRWLKGDVVVEIDENMLRSEISRMRALREETEPAAWGDGAGEVSDDFEDEDLGDPLDLDLSEADQQDEGDEMDQAYEADKQQDEGDEMDQVMQAYEADKQQDEGDEMDEEEDGEKMKEGPTKKVPSEMQAHPAVQSNRQANLPESIKRRLAREARIQAEAKSKAGQAQKGAQQKQKEAQQKQKEAQQKQKEAQQKQKQKQMKEAQKAKADAQKKQKEAQQKQKQAKQMKEAYVYYATKFNESVDRSRRLQSMLSEAIARNGSSKNGASTRLAEETETLREKLAEMNLFNAKLLFTNKLLQNESLTKRQKAEVIERLDEAQNVREAKLVYESLVKALQGGSTGRVVSEGTSRGVIGSSSRPARPAATTATINEGFEAERWAKLAGILK